MATSGSVDFTLKAGDVVTQAFGKIGVKVSEQELEASEMQDGLDVLNLTLKSIQAQGGHLWARSEGVLFLDAGKTDYLIGPTGDNCTLLDDFIGTTTTSALIATDTIIPVVSSAGMVAGDFVGVKLDDNTRFWTTILTVDSAVQLTLAAGIPSGSALSSSVFTYTTIINRPLRVTSFRRKTFKADNEIPVNTWSRDEYFNPVNKESQGTVVNAYYSPLLGNGRLYVWQTASSVDQLVRFSFERTIEDVDDKENTLDVPVEWLETLVYGVAARLLDDYDAPIAKGDRIIAKAESLLDLMLGWDQEYNSIFLQPDFN